jgi:hypothetical protein
VWRFAYFEAGKCVNPIVRLNGRTAYGAPIDGYNLIPEDLKTLHASRPASNPISSLWLAKITIRSLIK